MQAPPYCSVRAQVERASMPVTVTAAGGSGDGCARGRQVGDRGGSPGGIQPGQGSGTWGQRCGWLTSRAPFG